MKKFLALALCLCALLSVCFTLKSLEATDEENVVSTLAKDSKPDVRNGDPSEGIYLL